MRLAGWLVAGVFCALGFTVFVSVGIKVFFQVSAKGSNFLFLLLTTGLHHPDTSCLQLF